MIHQLWFKIPQMLFFALITIIRLEQRLMMGGLCCCLSFLFFAFIISQGPLAHLDRKCCGQDPFLTQGLSISCHCLCSGHPKILDGHREPCRFLMRTPNCKKAVYCDVSRTAPDSG